MTAQTRKIALMDTTLRDGEQTRGVSFTPQEKLHIARALLGKVGVDRIEVASAAVSGGEKAAVSAITAWAAEHGMLERVEVLGFVDHKRSVDWILDAGGRALNLLAKGSEKHCRGQLRKTLPQHLEDVRRTVDYAAERGLAVNLYLEDWSNGLRDQPAYVYGLMEGLRGSAVRRYMLPDTLGVLDPGEVAAMVGDMVGRFGWAAFDFHPHNDYGLGTANALAAARAGASAIHCTVNCLGERAGNASLAEIAVALRDKLGLELGVREGHLAAVSELVQNFSGKWIADNAPIVGVDVFTQTSGIHADGDQKGGLYHNPISPERFGRQRSYALGKMSGKASLRKNLEELGLELSDENFQKVLARVVELGDAKKEISAADLPFIITDVLERGDFALCSLVACRLVSGHDVEARAEVSLMLHGERCDAEAAGNGGYDAFMNAVGEILGRRRIELPVLEDYQIRIPRGGQTNALTEATIIWSRNGKRFKTIGVDSDQVMAAVNSTLKMLNLVLIDQGRERRELKVVGA